MGHTNSTTNLALPQFIGTDKPTWLGDINGAFAAIDAYAGTNNAAVAAAASDASSAVSQASSAVNTANTANTTAGNASTAANNAVGVANTAANLAGAVDTKVGLLINLNTTDKSNIVNAINEIEAQVNAGSISVISDGVKTVGDLLDELFSQIDSSKMSASSILKMDKQVLVINYTNDVNIFVFSYAGVHSATEIRILSARVSTSSVYNVGAITTGGSVTVTDTTSSVPASGIEYKIVY